MVNQVVFVGRLTKNPEIVTTENNKRRTTITVAVNRGYKNVDGIYETDFINCTLWNGIAENTCEYCKKGDIVGIKGRIQTSIYEENEKTKFFMEIIAEKVTFLTNNNKKEDE